MINKIWLHFIPVQRLFNTNFIYAATEMVTKPATNKLYKKKKELLIRLGESVETPLTSELALRAHELFFLNWLLSASASFLSRRSFGRWCGLQSVRSDQVQTILPVCLSGWLADWLIVPRICAVHTDNGYERRAHRHWRQRRQRATIAPIPLSTACHRTDKMWTLLFV